MQKKILGKGLAVGVILLFIGVAVAPSINFNIVKASSDNNLIEVTSEACGIKGYGNTTVKLTKQQYQDLQNYLVDFRARLNKTTTREDMIPLFKEAVMELNKYGLLPKGMNLERAQKLVTVQYQKKNLMRQQEKISHHLLSLDNSTNYLCSIAGYTDRTAIFTPLFLLNVVGALLLKSVDIYLYTHAKNLSNLFYLVINLPFLLFTLFSYFFPLTGISIITIGFGTLGQFGVPGSQYPSNGWVISLGMGGKKMWNEPLIGGIPLLFPIIIFLCLGIIGFTGIKIVLLDHCFYLGSALLVDIAHNL